MATKRRYVTARYENWYCADDKKKWAAESATLSANLDKHFVKLSGEKKSFILFILLKYLIF